MRHLATGSWPQGIKGFITVMQYFVWWVKNEIALAYHIKLKMTVHVITFSCNLLPEKRYHKMICVKGNSFAIIFLIYLQSGLWLSKQFFKILLKSKFYSFLRFNNESVHRHHTTQCSTDKLMCKVVFCVSKFFRQVP